MRIVVPGGEKLPLLQWHLRRVRLLPQLPGCWLVGVLLLKLPQLVVWIVVVASIVMGMEVLLQSEHSALLLLVLLLVLLWLLPDLCR